MATPRICSIPDCGKPVRSRGYCSPHYYKWIGRGDPLAGKRVGDLDKFYREVVLVHEADECLAWPYATSSGYGVIPKHGKNAYVHRLVCEHVHGLPPTSVHQAAHSCGKGHLGCVAKRHLSWKTPAENSYDRITHGTSNRGEKHTRSKLTERDIDEIRRLHGSMSVRAVAAKFSISPSNVSLIQNHKTWGWLSTSEPPL